MEGGGDEFDFQRHRDIRKEEDNKMMMERGKTGSLATAVTAAAATTAASAAATAATAAFTTFMPLRSGGNEYVTRQAPLLIRGEAGGDFAHTT